MLAMNSSSQSGSENDTGFTSKLPDDRQHNEHRAQWLEYTRIWIEHLNSNDSSWVVGDLPPVILSSAESMKFLCIFHATKS